jgi:ribose-phosphate pyrophosphokinase
MELRLFGLTADRDFGGSVAAAAGAGLSPHEERTFEDGEHKARPLVSVRGADVYVLDSLYGDLERSANDKLCRILFFLGAVRDAGAASVTAVVPYLAYARKDRRTKPRDPVTMRYVAALFEAVGVDAVLTVDVHNPAAYQNAFRRRTEHLEGRPLFVRYLATHLADSEIAIVSPDAGGVKRADALRVSLAQALGRDIGFSFLEKHRSEGVVSGAAIAGDLTGRTAVIVDDLISSGTTLTRTAQACLAHGATGVWAAATHGLFVTGAIEALSHAALERVIVLNTVPPFRLPASVQAAKLVLLDAAPLLGEAIRRLHTGGSLVDLLADEPPPAGVRTG